MLVLFLGAAMVYLSFGEIETILTTLKMGDFWFVVLAILIQCAWFFVSGLTYLTLYRVLGSDGTMYNFSLMAVAAYFVNTVAPSAGMGGMAVFISNARRNKQSPGKATVASVLYVFLDYIAFLTVLMLGLIVLFRRND
ncbi:MAG TPA: lysylphosphatidylglycerol synthase domain-containing protein, partial [Anaerolineales bacterium]|nr:lysylphosphatidylglycerol synthase domain-containing protein [Anaerolineales bacterium]